MKKILIVGGGGREHSICWKLYNDDANIALYCAPGNAGTAYMATNLNIAAEDIDGIKKWCIENRPDMVVVGPEAPLCAGIADELASIGIKTFGPSKQAAQLEGSKSFAKEIMLSAGVPTAKAKIFSEISAAIDFLQHSAPPWVIKADGLAAGKGVAICNAMDEAKEVLENILIKRVFGDAGQTVLIEEYLIGEEVSVLGFTDGTNVVLMPTAQDHKRVFDNDRGPNTGGMGAYSPTLFESEDFMQNVKEKIFLPVLQELRKRNIIYKGVLYAGLIVTKDDGAKVLEFNCRFGDPEAEVLLPRLNSNLLMLMESCINGTLSEKQISFLEESCVCVVMASSGYPGSYRKGEIITGIEEASKDEKVIVFHAGTKLNNGVVLTNGGRVLAVTARGASLSEALKNVYSAVEKIKFNGAFFRKDIAAKALNK